MRIKKQKWYPYTKFPPEVLKEGLAQFCKYVPGPFQESFEVFRGNEIWKFDNETEFFADYRKTDVWRALFQIFTMTDNSIILGCHFRTESCRIEVGLNTRSEVEDVFEIFEVAAPNYVLPENEREKTLKQTLTIFISHGHSPQWRDLKDHLHEKHGFAVEAYETGARAGLTIVDVLESITETAGFALLVMTGEDFDSAGEVHARENVIHETGLFQGKLGFKRAIVLLEEGCKEFSNISGLQQIRFTKGNIKETFGEVLATIRREFGVSR